MSIQIREYVSKKTNRQIRKYRACVYDSKNKKTVWGKEHLKRADAVREEVVLIEDVGKGTLLDNNKMPFKDVAQLWFESMEKTYAESTFKGYKSYYNGYLAKVFDDVAIDLITPLNIQRFKNELSKTYKPATVNKSLNLLSMIFDFSISPLRLIRDNPCKDVKRDQVESPTHTTWDEKTISYFLSLDSVVNSDYYEMLILSLTTALRPGEVCGVAISSLKANNMLSLTRGFNKFGNTTEMKTKRSHRSLTLAPPVYDCLISRLDKKQLQKQEFLKHSASYNNNDFLFTYDDGTPITPNSYSRAFRTLVLQHNEEMRRLELDKGKLPLGSYFIPQIRLYDARHSFATNTILSGEVNEKVVSEIMGSSVETILKNYVHIGKNMHQGTLLNYSEKVFKLPIAKENQA